MHLGRNLLFYGDNLDVLRNRIPSASVDLVYLDPPFNSNRSYNVLFRHRGGAEAQAQIEAFDDTWTWSHQVEHQYDNLVRGDAPLKVADTLEGMRRLLGDNDVLAYLVMMAPRLLELHRVLGPTGSLYLHCDPTASHYLKLVLDSIFGPDNFRNEIVWRRTGSHGPRRGYGPIHDTIFFYSRSNRYYFDLVRRPYMRRHVEERYVRDEQGRLKFSSGGNVLTGAGRRTGESGAAWKGFDPTAKNRHWAIPGFLAEQMPPKFAELGVLAKLDALYQAGFIEIIPGNAWPTPVRYLRPGDGQPLGDIWAYQPSTEGTVFGTAEGIDHDVAWLGPTAPERLGYPTQKPVGLLERIIRSSCPKGGVVLDPFCGCGTTVDAAQKLGRRWIGIDITYLAIDLICNRLRGAYGDEIKGAYVVEGIPADEDSARALFAASPFDFERWAVSLVDGTPNEKQVGDRGIDGVVRFPLNPRGSVARALVSVKGGKILNPGMVRDLLGTVQAQRAEMGLLLTLERPTRGMEEAARHSGTFTWPVNHQPYPVVQLLTVADLLSGRRPNMPTPFLPYIQAKRLTAPTEQLTLG